MYPFHELLVKNDPSGGSMVQWGLTHGFCDIGPYQYTVEWAETPKADNWVEIPGSPVTETTFIVDPTKRLWSKDLESYYRITLTTATDTYVSTPIKAGQYWNKQDWLHAKYICKAERLLMEKFVGWSGHLLKRRIWGQRCPCNDYDTDDPADTDCELCYGTGILGGYWEAFPTYVYNMQSGPSRNKQRDDNVGMVEPVRLETMRILGYPHISSYDVFVNEADGTRWILRPTTTLAEIKSVPIVYSLEMRLAPYTDIVYKVPFIPNKPITPEPDYQEEEALIEIDVPDVTIEEPATSEEEEVEETEEPEEETEFIIPMEEYTVWWEQSAWWIGETVGAEESAVYKTVEAVPIPSLLHTFDWETVNGYPPGPTLELIEGGFTLSGSGTAPVDGDYEQAGTYNGMYVYKRK